MRTAIFAFDSLCELEKIAAFAPGASVYCRLLMPTQGAEWPLSRKFGCELDMAYNLLLHSHQLGLDACGVSFHVTTWKVKLQKLALVNTKKA